jgi:anaerobic selenocysteine-containing dehydrogenase
MPQTRREFLWTAGAAAAGLAWYQAQGVHWASDPVADAGWEPGVETTLTSACLICPARCGVRGRMVDGVSCGSPGIRCTGESRRALSARHRRRADAVPPEPPGLTAAPDR